MAISFKRAGHTALMGLILSLLFAVITLVVGSTSGVLALAAMSLQVFGVALVWFGLVILYHQRRLAEQEKLDMAQLAGSESSDTIFQGSADRRELFAVAQKRLVQVEKWFVPIYSIVIASYEIAAGLYLLNQVSNKITIESRGTQLAAVFMVIIAFVSFLISRYATGMSAETRWKDLRAGGSRLLASAFLCFLSAVALAMAQYKMHIGITILEWTVPILLLLLGAEVALNLILDIYRPRVAGVYARIAFDSRLLGLINEPGDILRTFASAIDYQFGFKVSETWFYRLLEKAVLPLVIFSILSLYALSCIVVVGPGHQGIIEHFGSYQKTIDAGLHLKLPWPFDVAIIHPTDLVQQINIGFVDTDHAGEKIRPPLLWGEKHYEEEYNLLVAADTKGSGQEGSVAISIVIAAVPVQYRIRDIKAFMYNHRDSKETLEAICYRELVRYAASARIETDGDDETDDGSKLSILGAGRQYAAEVLTERIQQEVDREGLGVEIVFLGLQGVHPPPEVATAYQEVIGAVQQKQAAILNGKAEKNGTLISLGGKSVEWAEELADLAGRYRQAREADDTELGESLLAQLKEAFAQSSGVIFKTLREADGYSFEKATIAEATGERFKSQVMAYQASPQIYKRNQRLAMLEETLPGIRKYAIVSGKGGKQVIIIDVQEDLTPSLFDMNMDLSGQ